MSRLEKFRGIVDNHQYAKIDGVMIDVTSANAVLTVYNAISPRLREIFTNHPADKMVKLAWKIITREMK